MKRRDEKPLPRQAGDLIEAAHELELGSSTLGLERMPEQIRHHFAAGKGPITNASLNNAIPQADDVTRQELFVLLQSIEEEATGMNNANPPDPGGNLRQLVLATRIHHLREFETKILRRISLFEGRLVRFRRELENYFGD
jgi:hypothetical protein